MPIRRWNSAQAIVIAALTAGALFVAADLTRWGTWRVPAGLLQPLGEQVVPPGLPMIAAALSFAGAVVTLSLGTRWLVIAVLGCSIAAMAVSIVLTVLQLHDIFTGVDTTDWARYALSASPTPSHSWGPGLFAALAGLGLLVGAVPAAATLSRRVDPTEHQSVRNGA